MALSSVRLLANPIITGWLDGGPSHYRHCTSNSAPARLQLSSRPTQNATPHNPAQRNTIPLLTQPSGNTAQLPAPPPSAPAPAPAQPPENPAQIACSPRPAHSGVRVACSSSSSASAHLS